MTSNVQARTVVTAWLIVDSSFFPPSAGFDFYTSF